MYEEISRNKVKTWALMASSFLFLGLLGYAIGLISGSPEQGLVWAAIGLVIAAIMSFSSYMYGDRMVLASTGAQLVTPEQDPRLHNIVEGLSIAAGIPKPAVYIVPEQAPNAFATGRDPEHSSIAVTQGLLDMMSRVELEGVIAHELAHVQDRDILIGTVVATLVGAAVLLSEFFLRWMWIGGRRRSGNDAGGNPIFMIIGIVLLILAPIIAQVIKLAVTRKREYLADAQGAMLTRYPPGLAAALRKIGSSSAAMRTANNATAHLWLSQPSRLEGEQMGMLERLFQTHPPISERIRILEEM